MAEIPILFSPAMVRSLRDGRKTQTRRPVSPVRSRIRPGDVLWVRESIWHAPAGAGFDLTHGGFGTVHYLADGELGADAIDRLTAVGITKPRPSIHMPRWASRLSLVVEEVREEHLKDITDADAEAEGATGRSAPRLYQPRAVGWHMDWPATEPADGWQAVAYGSPRIAFLAFWEQLNGEGSADANPAVLAIRFRVIPAHVGSPEVRRAATAAMGVGRVAA